MTSRLAPTSRDNDSAAHSTGGADQLAADTGCRGHATKADKHRRLSTFEERFKIRRKGCAIGEHPRARLEDLPPGGGGHWGERGIGSEPGVVREDILKHVIDRVHAEPKAVVVDALERALIPNLGSVAPALLDAGRPSFLRCLTRRRREVRRWQRDRGVNSRHTANALALGNRRRCVLVRVGADDDITTIGGGTNGLELVGDEVRHRFPQPTQFLGSERRCRTGALPHLDPHRHRLQSKALRPVDEIRRDAHSHCVSEFSQFERQSECGLHIAPCSDSCQQCAQASPGFSL